MVGAANAGVGGWTGAAGGACWNDGGANDGGAGGAGGENVGGGGATGRGGGAGGTPKLGSEGRGVDAITSTGGAAAALTLVGSSSSVAPIASSIRVSPTTIVSPDCSLALLTFCPLTNVPLVEPRSMMLTSPGPLTSMIACMRLTVSSSSLRCAEGTLPSLITLSDSRSSRTSSSPLKIRNVSGTLAPAIFDSPVRSAVSRKADDDREGAGAPRD